MINVHYERIKEDLQKLGIQKGDTLLIHSSFKSLGYVEGGIQTLIEAILSQLGERGTLLIPTLTYAPVHAMAVPTFDIRTTPSCVGAVTEFFRNYSGVKRSMHPTHSVCAYGFLQNEFIQNHLLDNEPVGANSPFTLLPQYGGKILLLGCRTQSNTSMHGIEEYAKVPYILSNEPRDYVLIDETGTTSIKPYYWHYMKQRGYRQGYDRLETLMNFHKGNILQANCNLIDSPTMWKVAIDQIQQDPYFFTYKNS